MSTTVEPWPVRRGLGAVFGIAVLLLGPACSSTAKPAGQKAPSVTPTSTQATPTAKPGRPNATGDQAGALSALLTKGRAAVFHARLTPIQGADATPTANLTLELWNQPPLARRDTQLVTGQGTVDSSELRTASGIVRCTRNEPGPWGCVRGTTGDGDDPADLVYSAIATEMVDKTVTAQDRIVGDHPSRCFTLTAKDQSSQEVCLTDEGIPTRVVSGSAIVEVATIDQQVSNVSFNPPAATLG